MTRCAAILALVATMLSAAAAAQPIPASLAPPQGSVEVGRYPARGTQNYVCAMKHGALSWTFKAPEAALTTAGNAPFAHHFAGPTWQATDGSRVLGKLVASVPSPKAEAVPWLLLSATSSGARALARVRNVQPLDTLGGAGPKRACSRAGEAERVAYTATYVFFR